MSDRPIDRRGSRTSFDVASTSMHEAPPGSPAGRADAAAAVVADAVAIALEAEAEAAAEQVRVTAAAIAIAAGTAADAAAKARGARAVAVAEAARLVANDATRTASALQERAEATAAFFADEVRQAMEMIATDERGHGTSAVSVRLMATMRTLADATARDSAHAAALAADEVALTAADVALAASTVELGVEIEVTDAADALRDVTLAAARRVAGVTHARAAGAALAAREAAAAVVVQQADDGDTTQDDVLAIASHELRTPLSSISAHAEMLLGEGGLTYDQTRSVVAIVRGVARLADLTDDLLILAGLDAAPWQSEACEIDLRSVVSSARDVTDTLAPEKALRVAFEMPADPVLVTGKAGHLERLVVNLMSNAIKFSEDHGTVTCRLSTTSTDVFLTVADAGIGIPAAEQDLLFARFFRGSAARTRGIGGTGLGLHIVSTIVGDHGGDVSVDSVVGEGSTFTVRLPRRLPGQPGT